MIRAVVFDFYGTLTPGRSDEAQERARRAQAEALGVDAARLDAELTATVHARFSGAGGTVAGSLAWVTKRLGYDLDAVVLERGAAVRLAAETAFGQPRPEAVEVLRALRERGLPIGLVSDCSAELPEYFPSLTIAPYIDVTVFSFVTGHRKPAPENYLACAARLGVEPEECLYVGDGGSDELAGATRVGMRAVHLDITDESGGVVYGRHTDWHGERVTRLVDLLDLC